MRRAEKAFASAPRDRHIASGVIIATMVATLVLLVAIAGGLALFFPDRINRGPPRTSEFPAPAVIVGEGEQRVTLEAAQARLLAGGGGRLPIDEAMQRIVARGTHAYDPIVLAP